MLGLALDTAFGSGESLGASGLSVPNVAADLASTITKLNIRHFDMTPLDKDHPAWTRLNRYTGSAARRAREAGNKMTVEQRQQFYQRAREIIDSARKEGTIRE